MSQTLTILTPDAVQDLQDSLAENLKGKVDASLPAHAPQNMRHAATAFLLAAARHHMFLTQAELRDMCHDGIEALRTSTERLNADRFFDPETLADIDRAVQKRKSAAQVDAVFGGKDRLYATFIQPETTTPRTWHDIPRIESRVQEYLKRKGMKIEDYAAGYATDKRGLQRFSIGKLLAEDEKLRAAFEDDGTRLPVDKVMAVFTRNAEDLMRMSAKRAWSNCMSPGGESVEHVARDIQAGSIAAYLVTRADPLIHDPLARILLKPYRRAGAGGAFSGARIFIPAKRYGIASDAFSAAVRIFAETKLNAGHHGKFKIDSAIYADSLWPEVQCKNGKWARVV